MEASIAQTPAQRKIFTEEYASRTLKQFGRTAKKEGTIGRKLALEYALKNRIPLRKINIDGSVTELININKFGVPIFYRTYNNNAALSTRASFLNSSGSLGLGLDGENMTIGVWDGGHPRITHQEFRNITGKVTIGEESTPTFTPTLNFHAAHVVGTITASGVLPSAKGMAPKSKVIAFDWNDDFSEAISQAFNGLLVSSHSYGWDPEELRMVVFPLISEPMCTNQHIGMS
ncbi:hypothetical protein GHT06_004026 [Daphnia sinensis]|uniref:Uncharacterized protein n=1 Tax=Daphnia sinensis TaxID=1820382 RepID=A0AAD5L2K3_9CRUS|nr:hypothetical protein GHT06_004026 [Daphnia sinensis]